MPNTHTTLTSLFSAIADAIRAKTGGSADIVADSFPTAISSIPTGSSLPQLTEPAAAGDILSGKEALNGQGSKLTGTLNICDSISVDEVYPPSEGVASMQVTSTKDDSAKVITWQEPDVLPENIVAGKTILCVTGTYEGGGESLINGRHFECGTFTFPSTVSSSYTIQHTLKTEPSAVFLWVVDPGYSVTGQIGKFRADSTTEMSSVAMLAVNGGLSASTGAAGLRYRLGWDSTTITFSCDSVYPLIQNIEYQWLAIA